MFKKFKKLFNVLNNPDPCSVPRIGKNFRFSDLDFLKWRAKVKLSFYIAKYLL